MKQKCNTKYKLINKCNRKYRLIKPYVYIVYECGEWNKLKSDNVEGVVHGVYINREEAVGKKHSLGNRPIEYITDESGDTHPIYAEGYIAILKKPLNGKDLING